MPQIIRCPHCTKSMQVPDNVAGKTLRCPSCNKPFGVPALSPVGAAAPSPPYRPPSGPELGNGARAAAAAPPVAPPTKCPACGSSLVEGAVACMDCGYLLQSDTVEPEGPPNLCVNPACGVANPPGERNWTPCLNALAMAGGK